MKKINKKEEDYKLKMVESILRGDFFPDFASAKNNLFFGRKEEKKMLNKAYENTIREGILLGIYGVRRSGKTYLIDNFIKEKLNENKNSLYIKFVGNHEISEKENLEQAVYEVEKNVEDLSIELKKYKDFSKEREWFARDVKVDWNMFFLYLRAFMEKIEEDKKIFIFFDEMAWFSNKRGNFMSSFSYFWNRYCSSRNGTLVFAASSSKSWMESSFLKIQKVCFKE